jgi:hypothetical protein
LVDNLVGDYFFLDGKFLKVLINVPFWDFSSDLADKFPNVLFGVDAFVFWIFLKFVYLLLNFLFSCDDLRQTVHKFLHFLFFLRTGSHVNVNDPDGGDG